MAKRASGRGPMISGTSPGSNSDILSQSGGIARTFQSTYGSKGLRAVPGTNKKSTGQAGLFPGQRIAVYGASGNATPVRSSRTRPPGITLGSGGNSGPTNASIVTPKALGPKGFGGNYRLSKGY